MQYVAEFSTGVEYVKQLKKENILHLIHHPVIPGDIFLRIIVEKEELPNLPFKSYSDDHVLCEEKHGGLKVWKAKDTDQYRGENRFQEICWDYGYHDLVDCD
jgi:hypothetical protein